MGRTVKEVIKVIAPIALDALAEAAGALLAASASTLHAHRFSQTVGDVEADANTIWRDTSTYVNQQFSNNYRYFYKGLGSSPPHAQYPLIGATEDIIVWNPNKNETADIDTYLQQVLQDTLPDSDTIEVAQNIAALFQTRFADVELSWTPFNKRYNLADTGTTIDLMMVTAAGYDSANNPIGIATYCFVAYKTTNA